MGASEADPVVSGQDGGSAQEFITTSVPSAQEIAAREAAEKRRGRQHTLDESILPFLQKHCADCHGPDSEEAGINVAEFTTIDQFLSERSKWERIYRMINAGAMPPADYEPRPEMAEQQKIAELLYDELFNFDCNLVENPGRSTVQRLNRTEYNNTIRDLFGITITPADDFPADDVGEGFDNIGDVLSLPPLLMEKYLNAAEQVAAAVIDTKDYSKPETVTYDARRLKSSRGGGLSGNLQFLSTNGDIYGTFEVPADGEYEIHVRAQAHQMGNEKARFVLTAGKQKLGEFEVIAHKKDEDFSRKVTLSAGSQRITASFVNDAYVAETGADRNFGVRFISLIGPAGGSVPERTEAHRRFVTATPEDIGNLDEAAARVLGPFLQLAFRRPVTDAEIERFVGLVRMGVEDMGETYEGGLSLALQAILVSPDFLFRLEAEPAAGQTERPLNDFEIATRLSYFLWSTMPDDELFRLALAGKLHEATTLRSQISRMLKDEKSEALVSNFASQWLNLRNLDEVTPDPEKFSVFNDDLRRDMRRETELLFRAVMREDRNVAELLSADFTFVNERLAKHYGLSGIDGNEFERVSLTGTHRSGVLTHASILTLTSDPGRTSPVKRGKWIMENIFGESPPPPPPDVPDLEVTANASPDASLREQLEKHRADPGCASCHKAMDPLGLGFENFDAIGRWRDSDEGKPVDASGELPSGQSFQNPEELLGLIRSRRDQFLRTLTQKMLVYATGRGTKYYDKCAVDKCLDLMKQRNNRFSALVEGIVLSDPFLKRSAADSTVAAN